MRAIDALRNVPLFADVPPDELERLAEWLRPRQYQRGELIFQEGDPGTGLGIIESGRVKIVLYDVEGHELVLNTYGPGEFFGEFALLDGEPRSAGAAAQDDCRLFWLARDDFLTFLHAHPTAMARLLAILSRRLRHTTRQVQDAAFRDAPARLARALLDLAAVRGRPTSDGVAIEPRLTQTELASMIGTSRETVNKCLRAFQRRGLLRFEGGRITVLHVDELRISAE